ncbi:MAG: hypothetical protein K0S68_569 [Candidatus Saccharibacteria bacterium]|jgi:hypothetical protein|nr:hypothetical protein [Candidatus Saccharibacteria bacterium]
MNTNMKLELNMATLKSLLAQLQKYQALLYGLALVAVFGYTAYIINTALNVEPATAQTTIKPLPAIKYDRTVMESLSTRGVVDDNVQIDLGTTDPF